MKQKAKLDICNICLSEPVGVAQPSEAWLGRPSRGHPVIGLCPGGWPCCCLVFCFLFPVFFFFFLILISSAFNSTKGEIIADSVVSGWGGPKG